MTFLSSPLSFRFSTLTDASIGLPCNSIASLSCGTFTARQISAIVCRAIFTAVSFGFFRLRFSNSSRPL